MKVALWRSLAARKYAIIFFIFSFKFNETNKCFQRFFFIAAINFTLLDVTVLLRKRMY